jgi:hypothetical protein
VGAGSGSRGGRCDRRREQSKARGHRPAAGAEQASKGRGHEHTVAASGSGASQQGARARGGRWREQSCVRRARYRVRDGER